VADIPPVTTWSATRGKLRVWRGGVPAGEIPASQFPALIEALAREMQRTPIVDDPDVPLE
jgi:hypothetical protein